MRSLYLIFFFFNDTATTEIYTYLHTLSLHDALPISSRSISQNPLAGSASARSSESQCTKFTESNDSTCPPAMRAFARNSSTRSEEHTSELQSLLSISYAVFCLKKKKKITT